MPSLRSVQPTRSSVAQPARSSTVLMSFSPNLTSIFEVTPGTVFKASSTPSSLRLFSSSLSSCSRYSRARLCSSFAVSSSKPSMPASSLMSTSASSSTEVNPSDASNWPTTSSTLSDSMNTRVESLNVDEVVGQLLASEGFTSVEELALVDIKELAGIEGFDDETANELQSRAREYLEQLESELENKRKELGVDDALKTVPGVTSKMLVKFGENDIKTVEDLAGCATDDLVGWTERKEGSEPTKHPGILHPNEISRDDAEGIIMQARVIAGWITEADLAKKSEASETTEDQPV